jgi:hypothetical protein
MTAAQQREEHQETALEPGLLRLETLFTRCTLTHFLVQLPVCGTAGEAGAVRRRRPAPRFVCRIAARGPGR